MNEIPNGLIIKSDDAIVYSDDERSNYKYSYEDVIKAAKKIKVANNTTLSQAVEQRARAWYRSAMYVNDNRMLNLPEFNYALNMLVRTPK
jgi:hypothetical protein